MFSYEFCMSLVDVFFFFKQKTAYEMRISDWSSDVCSSDLNIWVHPRVIGPSDTIRLSQKGGFALNVTIHCKSHPNVTDFALGSYRICPRQHHGPGSGYPDWPPQECRLRNYPFRDRSGGLAERAPGTGNEPAVYAHRRRAGRAEIGRAPGRERVCKYGAV